MPASKRRSKSSDGALSPIAKKALDTLMAGALAWVRNPALKGDVEDRARTVTDARYEIEKLLAAASTKLQTEAELRETIQSQVTKADIAAIKSKLEAEILPRSTAALLAVTKLLEAKSQELTSTKERLGWAKLETDGLRAQLDAVRESIGEGAPKPINGTPSSSLSAAQQAPTSRP